jgi:hypothetical protein
MSSDFWGEFSITGNELKTISSTEMKNIGSKSGNQISGYVYDRKIEIEHTFLDYLHCGMQVNCVVAIDFTGSNGNPQDPNSLHYINPQVPNQYENSILSVGTILQVFFKFYYGDSKGYSGRYINFIYNLAIKINFSTF